MATDASSPEDLLRAIRLYVWGFEFYTNRLRKHFGRESIWHLVLPRDARVGSLPGLGIRAYSFHGFGVRIEDENGLLIDEDFSKLLEAEGEEPRGLGWVDPWKFQLFLESLAKRCRHPGVMASSPRLADAVRAIPEDWMAALMREAREATWWKKET